MNGERAVRAMVLDGARVKRRGRSEKYTVRFERGAFRMADGVVFWNSDCAEATDWEIVEPPESLTTRRENDDHGWVD